MKTVEGDLVKLAREGAFDVIVHGCNCYCEMGAGIAKAIREAFPEACEADRETPKGDIGKLGTYSCATVETEWGPLTVVNAYTQYGYRGRRRLADYGAIRRAFRKIKRDFSGKRIGHPKIGAGLAGGDWETIAAIIDEELQGEDHTLVVFERG